MQGKPTLKLLAQSKGQVRHFVEGESQPPIHPSEKLVGAKSRLAQRGYQVVYLIDSQVGEGCRVFLHAIYYMPILL